MLETNKIIKCEKCLAHYEEKNNHTCDPLMKRLVEEKNKKNNLIIKKI